MPTRMLATILLQYHQKQMLVTSNASFTGFGRLPLIHIQMKFARNRAETASAAASMTCCASRITRGGKPNSARCEIEASRQRGERSHFCIVDATEPVRLHHPVPNAPNKDDQHNAFQVPPKNRRANGHQEDRSKSETPLETLE